MRTEEEEAEAVVAEAARPPPHTATCSCHALSSVQFRVGRGGGGENGSTLMWL